MVPQDEKSLELFLCIGLDERTARDIVKNDRNLTFDLIALIHQAGVTDGCDRTIGILLYSVVTKYARKALVHHPTLSLLRLKHHPSWMQQLG